VTPHVLHSFPTRRSSDLKAGIIRANGVLVTLPQHPEANEVIGRVAQERNARGVSAVPYMPPVSPNAESTRVEAGDSPARQHYERSEEHTSELQSRENLVC